MVGWREKGELWQFIPMGLGAKMHAIALARPAIKIARTDVDSPAKSEHQVG